MSGMYYHLSALDNFINFILGNLIDLKLLKLIRGGIHDY